MTQSSKNPTQVKLKGVRLSYAFIFTPRPAEDGKKPKYGVSLLIPKANVADKKAIEAAVAEAKKAGPNRFGQTWSNGLLKMPLRDGDAEKPGDPVYEGHWFMNANSTTKPSLFVKKNGLVVSPEDESEIYSGCYGTAIVNFYPFNDRSKGIACGLQGILKTEDGERLSGGGVSADDFDDDDDSLA